MHKHHLILSTYLVETMFYDEWALSGESSISKPQGTFVPKWEDIQDDPKPDLRGLLMRKKKRKEAPTFKLRDCGRKRCASNGRRKARRD